LTTIEQKHTETTSITASTEAAAPLSNVLVPLGSFLIGIPLALMTCSGWIPFGNGTHWCTAIQNMDKLLTALWWSSSLSLLISVVFFRLTNRLTWKQLAHIGWAGFCFMKNSLLLLLLSWTFTTILRSDLKTSNYIADVFISKAPLSIIPLVCFCTATGITAAIGSSWGMMMIMIPLMIPLITSLTSIAVPALPEQFALLIPSIGAILSGAAAGPQLSPITDAAIISSATAGTEPIQHIRTMFPYVMPPLISSIIGYLVLAQLPGTQFTYWMMLLGTLALTILLHIIAARRYRANSK